MINPNFKSDTHSIFQSWFSAQVSLLLQKYVWHSSLQLNVVVKIDAKVSTRREQGWKHWTKVKKYMSL